MSISKIPAIRAKAARQEHLRHELAEPAANRSAASLSFGGTTLFMVDIDRLLRRPAPSDTHPGARTDLSDAAS